MGPRPALQDEAAVLTLRTFVTVGGCAVVVARVFVLSTCVCGVGVVPACVPGRSRGRTTCPCTSLWRRACVRVEGTSQRGGLHALPFFGNSDIAFAFQSVMVINEPSKQIILRSVPVAVTQSGPRKRRTALSSGRHMRPGCRAHAPTVGVCFVVGGCWGGVRSRSVGPFCCRWAWMAHTSPYDHQGFFDVRT